MKSLTFVLVPQISKKKCLPLKYGWISLVIFRWVLVNDLLGERMNDLLSLDGFVFNMLSTKVLKVQPMIFEAVKNAAVAADSDVSKNFKKVLW